MLTALHFIWVVNVDYVSGIPLTLVLCGSITMQYSSTQCFIPFFEFSMNINITEQKAMTALEAKARIYTFLSCTPIYNLLSFQPSYSYMFTQ